MGSGRSMPPLSHYPPPPRREGRRGLGSGRGQAARGTGVRGAPRRQGDGCPGAGKAAPRRALAPAAGGNMRGGKRCTWTAPEQACETAVYAWRADPLRAAGPRAYQCPRKTFPPSRGRHWRGGRATGRRRRRTPVLVSLRRHLPQPPREPPVDTVAFRGALAVRATYLVGCIPCRVGYRMVGHLANRVKGV